MDPNQEKKKVLQQLMDAALKGITPGAGVEAAITGIKNAVAAYKNFAKEWDNLHGIVDPTKTQANPQRDILKKAIQPPQGVQPPASSPIQSPAITPTQEPSVLPQSRTNLPLNTSF